MCFTLLHEKREHTANDDDSDNSNWGVNDISTFYAFKTC